jgi:hypothetical protein
MSSYPDSSSGRSCLNHAERPAPGRCLKCRQPFCDTCLAFAVNGAPWCELCGNALLEELRPRWFLAGAVMGGALALVVLGYAALYRATGLLMWRGTVLLVLLVLGGAGRLAWYLLDRSTGDNPRVLPRLRALSSRPPTGVTSTRGSI